MRHRLSESLCLQLLQWHLPRYEVLLLCHILQIVAQFDLIRPLIQYILKLHLVLLLGKLKSQLRDVQLLVVEVRLLRLLVREGTRQLHLWLLALLLLVLLWLLTDLL